MTLARICGKCGTILNKDNTGGLQQFQPACNRCTHTNPTCEHKFFSKIPDICFLCGFNKNYKIDAGLYD